MARYELIYLPSIRRDLRGIPRREVQRILQKTEALRENPYPVGSIKLSGRDRYRIRQGDYRILYSVDDEFVIVTVVKIAHRREAYR
ncbi:MAG TPA: type II toxin-antitoxin system RelE/ParE family toxin [Rhodanobacteraceae bacterium]|jgi:mRNA interferase RelE/StbE